jgi:2-(1,2-epoxy-1,2-dihydrophenyl)acetyl-CoA isomerase
MPSRVAHEIHNHVGRLTFIRPVGGNTIDLEFGREFLRAARSLESSTDVRAVVMLAEGKNFCLGGDLKSIADSGSAVQTYLQDLTADLHEGMHCLINMQAPVIVAVNGTAAGAGVGLVLASDLAIAGRGSRFVMAYSGVGLTPDAGCSFMLPRAVGYKRAMELFVTNRVLDADDALAWGLVNQVVNDECLVSAANELAERIAIGPLQAFGGVKRLMAQAMPGLVEHFDRERLCIAARGASNEGKEGIDAFISKRAPRFPAAE